MKAGKALEQLVSTLEKVLSGSENAKVTAPAKLRDRTNGRLREHDVLITIEQGHHKLYTAIECRDRSRKITVNQVEGFSQKCDDTGVSKGVIVSPLGFWESAKEKAKHLNISCLTLSEAESFDWLLASSFKSFSWKRRVTNILLIPQKDPSKKPGNFTVLDKNGVEFTTEYFERNLHHQIGQLESVTLKEGIHPLKIKMIMDGFVMRDDDSGEVIPLRHANIYTEVEIVSTDVPLKKVAYDDSSEGKRISELAVAKIGEGTLSGELVFSHKPAEGTTVSFVPNKKGEQGGGGNGASAPRHT